MMKRLSELLVRPRRLVSLSLLGLCSELRSLETYQDVDYYLNSY